MRPEHPDRTPRPACFGCKWGVGEEAADQTKFDSPTPAASAMHDDAKTHSVDMDTLGCTVDGERSKFQSGLVLVLYAKTLGFGPTNLLLPLRTCRGQRMLGAMGMRAMRVKVAHGYAHWAQLRLTRFFFPEIGSVMLCGRSVGFRSGRASPPGAGASGRFVAPLVPAPGEETCDSALGVCTG